MKNTSTPFIGVNELIQERKKEQTKLFTKTRKFGFRVQRYKYDGLCKIAFTHQETGEEHCMQDNFEAIRIFVKQVERDYKLKQLGL